MDQPKEATPRQLEILAFISSYYQDNCRPPALRDIGKHFNFTQKAAYDHVRALERKGYIRRGSGARAIMILRSE